MLLFESCYNKKNTNKEKINENYKIELQKTNSFKCVFDNAMRENNNIKYFDKVYLSEKNYISRINGDGIDYLISALIKE